MRLPPSAANVREWAELLESGKATMSEQDHRTSRARPFLFAALVGAVGIQAWFLAGMHEQLKQISAAAGGGAASTEVQLPCPVQSAPDVGKNPPLVQIPNDDHSLAPLDSDSWDPFHEMRGLHDRMNEMFGDAFGRFHRSPLFGHLFDADGFAPNIDLVEEEGQFVVRVDVPGAEQNCVNVELEGQQLTISGSLDANQEDAGGSGKSLRRERRFGAFSRTLTLPGPVEAAGMKTELGKGVLEITIPKTRPRP